MAATRRAAPANDPTEPPLSKGQPSYLSGKTNRKDRRIQARRTRDTGARRSTTVPSLDQPPWISGASGAPPLLRARPPGSGAVKAPLPDDRSHATCAQIDPAGICMPATLRRAYQRKSSYPLVRSSRENRRHPARAAEFSKTRRSSHRGDSLIISEALAPPGAPYAHMRSM